MPRQEFHIPIVSDNLSPVELIHEFSALPKGDIKQVMQKGAVWLEDNKGVRRLRRAKAKLVAGNTLHVYFDTDVLNQTITAPSLIEDLQTYSIWFKPPGVLSQGSKWGDHCTINRWIEIQDQQQRPAFIVHRLDRAACGLMVIAHGKKIAARFGQLFESRAIEKIYRTRVHGLLEADLPLTIEEPLNNRSASTTVLNVLPNQDSNSSLVTIRIDTGRKHQIRQHLAGLNYPIMGDRLYGNDDHGDLQLCAWSLAFKDPLDQTPRRFQVPAELMPEELK